MIVVDASVVNKLFLPPEENRDQAEMILDSHLKGLNQIIVPGLLFYEVANTLATKTGLSLSKIKSNLKDLEDINLHVEHVTFELLNRAVTLSKKYKVSVYDAAYAVLAKEKKCELITADSKFISQVKLSYVKNLKDFSTGSIT